MKIMMLMINGNDVKNKFKSGIAAMDFKSGFLAAMTFKIRLHGCYDFWS